ncbi:hypothetical protein THAOC_17032 [Thalassiosira oceanica]|uniref:Alpha 1,4-glycosyltransferase domain-containing protein n=1 Tax=Thalassiosira oceanica TaxID=159749 RepID=K0SVT8_THAOC|nr:hypothetical protein THAOC_17032 [Thalassiosira oceanica]|eukprot:EJK62357.1 hypothetical protein THAOC_17032 [Thalassiosira oceanica]
MNNKVAKERIQRMKNLHPGFSVEHYDDVRGREFISAEYGSDHVDVFDKLELGQHKADFLRYCLLYKFGGYYLDMDMFPIRPTTACVPANLSSTLDLVSELSGARHCAAACDSTSPAYNFSRAWTLGECQPCNHIHNGFMIARAGAGVLRKLIGFMIRNPIPFNNGWMPCTHSYHFYVKAFYSLILNETGSGTVEPNRIGSLFSSAQKWLRLGLVGDHDVRPSFTHVYTNPLAGWSVRSDIVKKDLTSPKAERGCGDGEIKPRVLDAVLCDHPPKEERVDGLCWVWSQLSKSFDQFILVLLGDGRLGRLRSFLFIEDAYAKLDFPGGYGHVPGN